MALLGGHQRKTGGEIEAHLVAEYRTGTGAGAVGLVGAVRQHVLHQVEILFHGNARKEKSHDSTRKSQRRLKPAHRNACPATNQWPTK
ncbi:hypothetical protein D3C85_1480030 [compost metagenome]